MDWYALNKGYVNYLKKYDNIVPNVEYKGRMKCFLGVVFKADRGIDYFAPVTSYKPKFIKMKNDIDFFKIENEDGKIYGAIDINNMIPVPKCEYIKLTYENLGDFREFSNEREKKQYWKLLNKEIHIINKKEKSILLGAEKLYRFATEYPNGSMAQRCCDFKLLESKCKKYIAKKKNHIR